MNAFYCISKIHRTMLSLQRMIKNFDLDLLNILTSVLQCYNTIQ